MHYIMFLNHLNTSNVTVNLLFNAEDIEKVDYLNTSNVTVNQIKKKYT
ncbi:MAG: hypothetical protein Q607_CBUC00062G0017 [Clostridium butyricum DORA_1]|nr:MAG: hypothetical protein Q607_CBUC00062G0017 [Clostridium butyricum DORA_1]